MYEKVFDILNQKKLVLFSKIDEAIMGNLAWEQVVELSNNLFYCIEDESLDTNISTIQKYQFISNSRMSGLSGTDCDRFSCRERRLDNLLRFASLYADCIYIQNYFSEMVHIQEHMDSPFVESIMREDLCNNIKLLIELKPLLMNKIVSFIPSGMYLCHTCDRKIIEDVEFLSKKLKADVIELEKTLSMSINANIKILKRPDILDGHKYEIDIDCIEDISEHGNLSSIRETIPKLLQRKIEKNPMSTKLALTKTEILKTHLIQPLLQNIARDVYFMRYYQSRYDLRYLTDRGIDYSFCQAIAPDNSFQEYNKLLSNYFMVELPIFSNVPIIDMVKIREAYYDSFILYRNIIDKLVIEYISDKKPVSPAVAKELYQDLVLTNVEKLDKRVNEIRFSAICRSLKEFVISTGSLGFALFSISPPNILQSALVSLGISSALKSLKSTSDAFKTPNEIKNSNFYFAWKLSKKSRII